MFPLLISLVIGLFVAMLFLQFYFRLRVLKFYRNLVKNRVQFDAMDIFRSERLGEAMARHPEHAGDIMAFAGNIRYSIRMAMVLIFLITAFGAVLMYFR